MKLHEDSFSYYTLDPINEDESTDLREREELINEAIEKTKDHEESVARYRKYTQYAIAQWMQKLKNNEIPLKSVDDFEKLVKLELQLQKGEL